MPQRHRYGEWKLKLERPVVIEIGAGTSIPTVRFFSENQHCPLIRINLTEADVPRPSDISLPMGGTAGMQGIAAALLETGFMER